MAAQREGLTYRGIGPDAGDELAGDPPSMDRNQREVITVYSQGPNGPDVEWSPETGAVRVAPSGDWLFPTAAQARAQGSGSAEPRYTDTDLRALALEHAVATRSADDQNDGKSVVARADKFHDFLRGVSEEQEGDA